MAKVTPNASGVSWSSSKAGRLQIAVGSWRKPLSRMQGASGVEVWAIYTGTHDVAPVTKRFTGANANAEARAYANGLWAKN